MKVWDIQLARFGAAIIRQRIDLLGELLPAAEKYQQHISGQRESLNVEYKLSAQEKSSPDELDDSQEEEGQMTVPLDQMRQPDEQVLVQSLLRILREKRGEEIARKQTVVGPHRDDIELTLNGRSAVDFASQGQQRSLVLALKLAELERVSQMLTEPPVLLLDDVLAELDLGRQGLLMSLVGETMQTLITTTHVDGFRPEWLAGAQFLHVQNGTVVPSQQPCAV
jgi:DNA replication and repair protein RecF